ncbi:MAG: threonylcarbamoyl-AMP synthase [Deltaproteobacteria bacterium]|nr:threonylcarbamoyl-AMP synthase [Deltaproteobacteria bacterium]
MRAGKILIYPTETFYGLGVDIFQPHALEALFQLKGRDAGKAMSVLVSHQEQVKNLVSVFDDKILNLIDLFLPGPVTFVLKALDRVPISLQSEGGFVGIRMSPNLIAEELLKRFGGPITTTSANPSGEASARSLSDLKRYFDDREDLFFLSGGDLPPSRGSTVVKIDANRLKLLREGDIPFSKIETAFGVNPNAED